ncbi:MAG: DNA methylase [Firmicutes bacterium]|nr:DNA methylase [Bacillota bacterium]
MNNLNRQYLAIDLKSFYASVECVERGLDPLKAKLLVADTSRTDKTICLAVSPALKAYGISGRARLFEVNQRLKEIERATGEKVEYIAAVPQMAKYLQVSAQIYSIYLKYIAPEDMHIYSIDEVFFDVTSYKKLYKSDPHNLAAKLIKEVLNKTGITATAGIGTNMYLAKIAMDIYAKKMQADKDGVRIGELDEKSYRKYLWSHRPITDFWQIGRGLAKRLEKYQVYTMGDLAAMSLINEELLYKEFGINAEIMIDHAWGKEPTLMEDIKNYRPSVNSLSTGQVLSCPYTAEKARIIVFEMADGLSLDLLKKELCASGITLDIGYDRENVDKGLYFGKTHIDHYGRTIPEHAHASYKFINPTNSTKEITSAVLTVFDRIINQKLTIRRITINANDVISEKKIVRQLDLFTDYSYIEKEKKLQKAALCLKEKYGKNAILKGTNLSEGATAIDRNRQIGGHRA